MNRANILGLICFLVFISGLCSIGIQAHGQSRHIDGRVQEVGLNIDMVVDRLLEHLEHSPNHETPYYAIYYKRGIKSRLIHVSLNFTGNYYNKYFTGFYDSYTILDTFPPNPGYPSPDSADLGVIRSTEGHRYGIDLGVEWRKEYRYCEVIYGPKISIGLINCRRILAVESIIFNPPQPPSYDKLFNYVMSSSFYSLSLGCKLGVLLPLASHLFLGIEMLGEYVTYTGYIPHETSSYDLFKVKVDPSANRFRLRGDFCLYYRF